MRDAAPRDRAAIHVWFGRHGRVVAEIVRQTARSGPSSPIAWLGRAPDAGAWEGTRQLTARAAELLAPAAFDDLRARHRPVLALLYPEAGLALTAPERAARDALCADPRSLSTHSAGSWLPLIQAAAALIADALAATRAVAAVPELAWLDAQTRHALVEAFRVHGERLAGLHVGHDPAQTSEPVRVWGVPVTWDAARIQLQLCDYQLAPRSEVRWLDGRADGDGDDDDGIPPALVNAWSGRSPDAIALATLAGSAPPSSAALDDGVRALRWASRAHAFRAAFRIGALLEPHRHRLDPAAQAEHAALTAIAATSTHFVDVATPGFDDQLYAMHERAIALAPDAMSHAALSVRLAFAGVDRSAPAVDAYLARAGASVQAVADGPWARYLAAWNSVVQALHALHRHDLTAADGCAQAACAQFTAAAERAAAAWPAPEADRMQREAACGRFLVLSHAAIHAGGTDDDRASRWRAQAEHERASVPVVALFEVFHWVLLRQRDDDRAAIYERCLVGLRDAERCWEARSWWLYHAIAADCAYRTGRSREAAAHCRPLLAMTARNPANPLLAWAGDVRPLALRALLRSGDHAAFHALAQRCLADPAGPPPAELRAQIAAAHAACGEPASARDALERAVDDAVAGGDRAAMLRVATLAAQVMARLDDRAEALRALGSAWDLAEDEPGQFADPIAAPDRLRLCVLQARLAGPTGALLSRACAALPASLADAESWWDVAELLDLLAGWLPHDGPPSPEIEAGLATVRRLAPQRADWRAALDRLPAR